MLFIIAGTWKKLRYPFSDEQIKKLWYMRTMEYYSAINRNKFESVELKSVNLETVTQSEESQKEKNKHCIKSIYMGSRKAVLVNLRVWAEIEMQM